MFVSGIFKNGFLLATLPITFVLAVVMMSLNTLTGGIEMGTMMIEIDRLWDFVFPLPVAVLALGYDEMRRLIIRKIPNGWLEEETCI